jgi:multidrug efflux pump subunit AcrA (membrane-fusion protein)
MNNRNRTVILILIAVAISVLGMLTLKETGPEEVEASKSEVLKAVRVLKVELKENFSKVEFSGKLIADQKVELYSEVNGVLQTNRFRAGNYFKKGDVIAQLNSSELKNTIRASKSNFLTKVAVSMGDLKIDYPAEGEKWETFLNHISVDKPLPLLPVLEDQKLKRFISGKGILNAYYSTKSMEDKLAKFSIVAPFNGVLVQGDIKKGTLIKGGFKIGEFINTNVFELETEISLSDLKFVKVGYPMSLYSDELKTSWKGTVSRINSAINPSSQLLKIYVKVSGNGLKEGMYLYGNSEGASFANTISINRKLLTKGGVYLVKEGKVIHQKIEVHSVNQAVAIVSGLATGDEYIFDNMKGLYEGLKVEIIK